MFPQILLLVIQAIILESQYSKNRNELKESVIGFIIINIILAFGGFYDVLKFWQW